MGLRRRRSITSKASSTNIYSKDVCYVRSKKDWTSKEYDTLELIFKTLAIREDIALVKIAGCVAGAILGNEHDSIVAQYAIQNAEVYSQIDRIIRQMKILELSANGRRIACRGHVASSGGHHYLFVSFHVVREGV